MSENFSQRKIYTSYTKLLILNPPSQNIFAKHVIHYNHDLSRCNYTSDHVRANKFTRFRTSSHNININVEKGRWQRIPREQRYVIGCTRDDKISTRCIYTKRPMNKFNIC